MLALGLAILLGLGVLIGSVVARLVHIAPPVVFLGCGVLLGFLPVLRNAQLPPELVLLLFLPALLYWESLTTSPRVIRTYKRAVALISIVLVIATAAAVAFVAHALGLAWGPAWVLGAAVAPTDATAVAALARSLPRNEATILSGESLINDGTALVVYGLAVGVTVGEEYLSFGHVTWLFLLSYAGGVLAGALVAWLGVLVRRRLSDPILGNLAMLLIPFVAFWLAEEIHASGVLAVVACGLIMSQAGPRVGSAATRRQTEGFWSLTTFILNGALFVLVGVEMHSVIRGLTTVDIVYGLLATLAVYAVVMGARFAWLFTTPYLIRVLDRRPQQRSLRIGWRARVIMVTAGFRGAVSLAAALAVPLTLSSGAPFPHRDLIIFVTMGVVVLTLVVQGLLLPRVVKWARLPEDTGITEEFRLARVAATEEALDSLPAIAARLDVNQSVADRVTREYHDQLKVQRAERGGEDYDKPTLQLRAQYTALRLALIDQERETMLRLRDERTIDDIVLRQIQRALDLEVERLSRPHDAP
jgi:CPA1 family monovalent cation:H+ antiporter